MHKLVSIIIRTKNEEKWITPCLQSVSQQTYSNYEVILVDNNSIDETVSRASIFGVKVVHIKEFKPGLAINVGIRASSGEYIVCLSGHCVPASPDWLTNLVAELDDASIAGVYGRQEPLSFSSDLDKRDLMMVFGLDKKIQEKDPLFHNANSAFRREVWERFPFDETISNIEDRLWGLEVINAGLKILYEPTASVYHWHGIHHGQQPERASKIARILDSFQSPAKLTCCFNPSDLNVLAIIPIKGNPASINGQSELLKATISCAKSSQYINEIVISSDKQGTLALGKRMGATLDCLRPLSLSEPIVEIADVLEYTLRQVENSGYRPDIVVLLEETFPFRSADLIDIMINELVTEGYDSIVSVRPELSPIWVKKDDKFDIVTDGFMPSTLKNTTSLVGIVGCCTVAFSSAIRQKTIFSGNMGLHSVSSSIEAFEVDNSSITEGYSLDLISAMLQRNNR